MRPLPYASVALFALALLIGCDAESPIDGDGSVAPDGGTSLVDASSGADGGSVSPTDGGASGSDAALVDGGGADAGPLDAGWDPELCGVERADVSSPSASSSWRYGGGAGYPDRVRPDGPCTHRVRDRADLDAALAAAEPGHVVYIEDDAEIDLAGSSPSIPEGVTLASGRGRGSSPGGLLFTSERVRRPMMRVSGDDVRITGLRIRGADPWQCPPEWPSSCPGEDRTGGRNCRDCAERTAGIAISGYHRLEIDNCELAGFSSAAVSISDSIDGHFHHNDFHHNQRQGLGYGVVFGRNEAAAFALIEWNVFDYNRHAIAASGEPATSYTARYNLVLPHANGHVFDVHGHNENTNNGSPYAGHTILVHGNTVLPPDHYALVVRGRPVEGSWLYDNCLRRGSASDAAQQRLFFGNFWVDSSPSGAAVNRYGQRASDCETLRFCTHAGGTGPRRLRAASSFGLASLGFGDFDGDGRTDVFRADGEHWYWLSAGTGSWTRLNTSGHRLEGLVFGDFDGDGATDVFRANGSEWFYSRGGSGPWTRLRAATERVSSLGFGDFDGDGATDVFKAEGGGWFVSWGGTSAWERVNTSGVGLAALAFADLDGDGRDDVFNTTGSVWRYSRGGSSPWEQLNASSMRLDVLALADLDGDGRADVVHTDGTLWRVSWAGRSRWDTLRVASERLPEMAFGDFDGDGAADIFRTGCM